MLTLFSLLSATTGAQDTAAPPAFESAVSILDLMEQTITPASNTIWQFYEPPADDDDWRALEEAAVTMVAASSLTAAGGTGPQDNTWAADPRWQAFATVMMQASEDALAAVRARDHDALLQASDVLYPPCEGCHTQFNPGVAGID